VKNNDKVLFEVEVMNATLLVFVSSSSSSSSYSSSYSYSTSSSSSSSSWRSFVSALRIVISVPPVPLYVVAAS